MNSSYTNTWVTITLQLLSRQNTATPIPDSSYPISWERAIDTVRISSVGTIEVSVFKSKKAICLRPMFHSCVSAILDLDCAFRSKVRLIGLGSLLPWSAYKAEVTPHGVVRQLAHKPLSHSVAQLSIWITNLNLSIHVTFDSMRVVHPPPRKWYTCEKTLKICHVLSLNRMRVIHCA